MTRILYAALVRLHPRSFRDRFGEEMIHIFDEELRRGLPVPLLLDALFSLFRQWVLRPAKRGPAFSAAGPSPRSDIPSFHILASGPPRRTALANGAVLTVLTFSAVSFAIGRGGDERLLLIGAKYPRSGILPVDRSSIAEAQPDTEIKIKPREVDPLYKLADVYFKIVRVLDVLDADADRTISPWEIMTAAAPLAKLDIDHDGYLSAEECGFLLEERAGSKLGARFVENAKSDFMRAQPVLAALDRDQDGRISAAEIGSASGALRSLDKNQDGHLAPAEVLPELVDPRISMILSRLDINRDRKISVDERATQKAEPLREILESADRDGDGMITATELKNQMQLRDLVFH